MGSLASVKYNAGGKRRADLQHRIFRECSSVSLVTSLFHVKQTIEGLLGGTTKGIPHLNIFIIYTVKKSLK